MNIHTIARIYNNTLNVANNLTAVQLSSDQPLRFGVTVLASSTNSNTVYVGNSGVTTTNGFPLSAGASIEVQICNISKLYLVGSGNVRWIGG